MTTNHDLFTQIAREHLLIETLEERKRDSLDFHELAIWQIKAALIAAYKAGRQTSKTKSNSRPPELKP